MTNHHLTNEEHIHYEHQAIDLSSPVIELRNVSVAYQTTLALNNASLKVYKGEIIGICGPNGAGKTTLLKAILGLVKPYRGKILIYGEELQYGRNLFKSQHYRIGYVPQLQAIDRNFPALVEDVVMMGRYPRIGFFKRPTKEDWTKVHHALKLVGMFEMRKRPIGHLSSGQQQKVFIARALALEPEILLLDEPTSALDFKMTTSIMEILERLNHENDITIISIHHDLSLLKKHSSRIVCVNKEIIWTGPPNDPGLGKIIEKIYPMVRV